MQQRPHFDFTKDYHGLHLQENFWQHYFWKIRYITYCTGKNVKDKYFVRKRKTLDDFLFLFSCMKYPINDIIFMKTFSLMFLYTGSDPVTVALLPITLFAILHSASYSLTLLDTTGKNNSYAPLA